MINSATRIAIDLTERGLMPDSVLRRSIRLLLKQRLKGLAVENCAQRAEIESKFLSDLQNAPVAIATNAANEQHYEVPAEFFKLALGSHLKYSSCYFEEADSTLDAAEAASLALSCEHAALADGQDILELGCGWGSLSLWMAEHYPNSSITAVSNSNSQREHILARASERGLDNLQIITADMNEFNIDRNFDRVVSVEMFEHMRNWPLLMQRVHECLNPGGRFFMHVFCHATTPYLFEDLGPGDWMSRHFFTGGMMPSDALAHQCRGALRPAGQWRWSGDHYARTAEAWLDRTDANRDAVLKLFASTYGSEVANLWLQRWRVFFMACAELFAYDKGQSWWVSHYAFEKADQ